MLQMKKMENKIIVSAKCNKCGKTLKVENGYIAEGAISISERWGYFSKKDLEQHSFELCEKCYDEIVSQFKIPVTISEYVTLEKQIR